MTRMPTSSTAIQLEILWETTVGSSIGQLRAVPVTLGPDAPRAFLVAYCADFDVDPWGEMFFFPSDTLKLALFTEQGGLLWRRDLGRGVVPGMWFCPVFPFDLDGDGVDEIWFVNNPAADHPLGLSHYRLERLDGCSGQTTGHWPWPHLDDDQSLSHLFRNFILGGHVRGEPVLVTAQGTYASMFLQGWRPDMSLRWQVRIGEEMPGARGSHQCPIVDIDGDGSDELFWGERCLRLDTGEELFCADRDVYRGHSDIVQPVLNRSEGHWQLYTCREGDIHSTPRVVLFDDRGERIWGQIERGHMDMGWVARLGDAGEHVAMAIRIGNKTCGPDGRFHHNRDEFTFDLRTGASVLLPFSVYQTLPVDLDGDGCHELVRGIPGGNGEVLDRHGRQVGSVGGPIALASRFWNHPGEQVLTYHPDGMLRIWGDRLAQDCELALARYAHPFYRANSRLSSSGSNLGILAGL